MVHLSIAFQRNHHDFVLNSMIRMMMVRNHGDLNHDDLVRVYDDDQNDDDEERTNPKRVLKMTSRISMMSGCPGAKLIRLWNVKLCSNFED